MIQTNRYQKNRAIDRFRDRMYEKSDKVKQTITMYEAMSIFNDYLDEISGEWLPKPDGRFIYAHTMVELLKKAWHEGESEGIRRAEAEFNKGYQEGYDKGLGTRALIEEQKSKVYQHGLDKAWECARKIAEREDDMRNCFHDIAPAEIFDKYSASEAIEKIKKWEEKQKEYFPEGNPFISKQDDTKRSCSTCADSDKECNDHNLHCDYSCWTPKQYDTEIRVDDEVIYKHNGEKGVVLNIVNHSARVMFSDRISYKLYVDDLIKTGRHYDIESILKQMHEG